MVLSGRSASRRPSAQVDVLKTQLSRSPRGQLEHRNNAGIAGLSSHEGMEIVCEGLNLIRPDSLCRPNLMFYDIGCKLRTFSINRPNPSWLKTRYVVDRYAPTSMGSVQCQLVSALQ